MSYQARAISEGTNTAGSAQDPVPAHGFDSTAGVAVAVSVGVVAAVAFSTIIYKEYRKKKRGSKTETEVDAVKLENGVQLGPYTTNESIMTYESTAPLQTPREAKVNKYPVGK